MSVGDNQINLGRASPSQVLQQAGPSIFAFLSTSPQSQDLFVSAQIDPYCRQDDSGISLVPVTNAEMHPIQVQDTPVLLERALPPSVKLLGQRLVETTNRAGTGSHSQQRFGDFPHASRVLTPDTNI